MNIIASSPQGLENILAKEISDLGGEYIKTFKRFVSFSCDHATFYRLHFFSRIPFHFYREIARFSCHDRKSLYTGVQSSFDWIRWISVDMNFRVEVTGSAPLLRHSHFTALEVKNSIIDLQKAVLGDRSNISLNNPDIIIHLHLYNEEAVLSLQSTSQSLHKRGYRPAMASAPLKENVAAGLLRMTSWDGTQPLVDLMCGSGTFLIEGILTELNLPNLNINNYLFTNWIDFKKDVFQLEKSNFNKNLYKNKKLSKVIGCEICSDIFNQAITNISLAGVQDYINLHNIDFYNLRINFPTGVLVCNPPYGIRLGDEDSLIELYTKLGEYLKLNCSGWEFWLLSGNAKLTKYLKMKASLKIPITNGGIDCRWIKYLIR